MPIDIAEYLVLNANQENLQNKGVTYDAYRLIYRGNPPWEIGKPQPAIVELTKDPDFKSPILDIGCGQGVNTHYLATQGYEIGGIDFLPEVIATAQQNSSSDKATFWVADALELKELINNYNTVLDSATFHGFSDEQRERYCAQLCQYMKPDSYLYILGFSEQVLNKGGPRRLSRGVFETYFQKGWSIESVESTRYFTTIFNGSVKAILAKIRRNEAV